ncbi:MAG: shikimate dehydrogenase [Actinomycetes bacterium]
MPLTGVAGWPVAHSRTPALHAAAFNDLGLQGWESQLLPIPPDVFSETAAALPGSGFVGINVTIPHKEAAFALADVATADATAIGAANTLTFRDGTIHAANTDAPAIRGALLASLGTASLEGLSVLVLGAGGSARAAAYAAVSGAAAEVSVWNRTPERAIALAASIDGVGDVAEAGRPDVVINATSVGLTSGDKIVDLPLEKGDLGDCRLLVDLVYGEHQTPIASLGEELGLTVVDGLEILVRQGALSIEIWTGGLPSLDVLREAVKRAQ